MGHGKPDGRRGKRVQGGGAPGRCPDQKQGLNETRYLVFQRGLVTRHLPGRGRDAGSAELMANALGQSKGPANLRMRGAADFFDEERPKPIDLQRHRATRAWRRNRPHRARWPPESPRRLLPSETEIMTTGRGASIMICPRHSKPSMPGIWTSSVTTCGSNDRTSSSASVPLRASRISKSPSSRKMPSSSFRISAELSAMRSLITKPSMPARIGAVEFCQHVRLDLIQELRRIDKQDHPAFRIQVCHAADQAHLLGRHLRRRTNAPAGTLHDFRYSRRP